MPTQKHQTERANANPSKTFFISMLTRDIDLIDCILDLLDNAVDGIGETAKRENRRLPRDAPFSDHEVRISLDKDHFEITDRSGGIPLEIAHDYAFRFGRSDDAPETHKGTIGIYGIGMKRAMFKMGNLVTIKSGTSSESWELELDVEEWRKDPQTQNRDGNEVLEWSFELTNVRKDSGYDVPGTSIRIEGLHEGIWRQFDSSAFLAKLRKRVARDYAFILNRGLTVVLNDAEVAGQMPSLKEGSEIEPIRHVETRGGVKIEIMVGLSDVPPDDVSANSRKNNRHDQYGWYVVCNDRVVVSADKSAETGWGIKPVPAWHPQFGGFIGVARFTSDDPSKLPWKTTKRDIEESNVSYQHALPVMMRATKKITDYTNVRRADAKRLKKVEKQTANVPIDRLTATSRGKLPKTSLSDVVSIEYQREGVDVRAVAEALDLVDYSPAEIGIRTFEYFLEREVGR